MVENKKLEKIITKELGKKRISVQQAKADILKAKQAGMNYFVNSDENHANTHKIKTGEFKDVYAVDLNLFNKKSNHTGRGDYRLGIDKQGNELYIFAHKKDGTYKPLISLI